MNYYVKSTDAQDTFGTLEQEDYTFGERIKLSESNCLTFVFSEGKEVIGTAVITVVLDDAEYKEEIEESLMERPVIGKLDNTMLCLEGMYIKPEYRGHKLQNLIKLTKDLIGHKDMSAVIGPVCVVDEKLTKEEMLNVVRFVYGSKKKANEGFVKYLKNMI